MNARLPFGKTQVILIVLLPLLAMCIMLTPGQMVLGSEQLSLNRFVEPGHWFEIGSGSASGRGLSNTGSAYKPAIAADADGNLALVWADRYKLYARYWNGQKWTQFGSPSGGNSGQENPAIALGKDGWAVLAWNEWYGIGDEIVVKQWDGEQWSGLGGGGGMISNRMGATHPAVAIAPDNKVYVAWHDSGDIYARCWDGQNWLEIGPGSASGDGISGGMRVISVPSLALDAQGYPTVAWNGQSAVVVTRWTGSEWIKLETLKTTETSAVKPALAFLADDSPIVAWEERTNNNLEIYVRRWNGTDWVEMGSGSASGGGVSDNIGNSLAPALASNANGSPVLAWQDDTSDSWQIYARMWNGSSWTEMDAGSASGRGISAVDGSSKEASVAVDAAGKAYVVWSAETAVRKEIFGKQWLSLPYVSLMPAQQGLPGTGWEAGVQVQNNGSSDANMVYTGYGPDGTFIGCIPQTAAPESSITFLTDYSCPGDHVPFSAAAVRSQQPVEAMVNVSNRGIGMAGGQYRATNIEDASTELFFPLVKNDHNGRTTAFAVQNASDETNEIVAVFNVQDEVYSAVYKDVAPYASVLIYPDDANVPPGFGQVGSLTLSGSRPIAGASFEHDKDVIFADNLQAARGFSPADPHPTLYCPLFRNAHAARQQTTGVQVQNVSSNQQDVTFTYYPIGDYDKVIVTKTIKPGASATYYAPAIGIPKNTVGSVTLEGPAEIVAVVNDQGHDGDQRQMTTYTCFPADQVSDQVLIPLFKEMYRGNTTGIQVQNVSGDGSQATVTLTYRVRDTDLSVVFTHNDPISDGGSITFWAVSELASPQDIKVVSGDPSSLEGTVGSVVIESDQPIVAIANETSYGPEGSVQDAKNYEGINQ